MTVDQILDAAKGGLLTREEARQLLALVDDHCNEIGIGEQPTEGE